MGRSGTSSTFIIHQGRIQEVALLSAAGRLRLLLSAGSGAFIDAKAKETEQLLQQAGQKIPVVTGASAGSSTPFTVDTVHPRDKSRTATITAPRA